MIICDAHKLSDFKRDFYFDVMVLTQNPALTVKLEQLNPGASHIIPMEYECFEKHVAMSSANGESASKFYYILEGEAMIESGQEELLLGKSQGIHIPEDVIFKIKNIGDRLLKFLVVEEGIQQIYVRNKEIACRFFRKEN